MENLKILKFKKLRKMPLKGYVQSTYHFNETCRYIQVAFKMRKNRR